MEELKPKNTRKTEKPLFLEKERSETEFLKTKDASFGSTSPE